MSGILRRFGPPLLWQLVWLLLLSLLIALVSYFWANESLLWFAYSMASFVAGYIGAFLATNLILRISVGKRARSLSRGGEFSPLIAMTIGLSGIPVNSTHSAYLAGGLVRALFTQAVILTAFFAFIWLAWGLGRLRPTVEPPRREVGIEIDGMRLAHIEPREGTFEVRVVKDRIATLTRVLEAVLAARLLPAVPGGRRKLDVFADERRIATITQTWEYSRWWPIEWHIDADEPFTADSLVFALVEEPSVD